MNDRKIYTLGRFEIVKDEKPIEFSGKVQKKALEINDLEEEFYRALMLCYGKLGRRADVQTTYNRLGKLLASVLAAEPSLETKAAYKKAMAG